ncbi:MAG TPA: hypothetical protein VHC98_02575 [Candidatus Saccharimonadales bacterium]|nr:hypothetical protein [Candidatus Saccharimonadales bacterium]
MKTPEVASMSADDRALVVPCIQRLERAKPLLAALAGEVLEAYPRRGWDVLIGDDTSGRLVAHFIRRTLAAHGVALPARFICASHTAQHMFSPAAYERYVDHLADGPLAARRPLIVSENTLTGGTLHFLDEQFSRRFAEVDFALAAARYPAALAGMSGEVYVGGEGCEASAAAYQAFETVGQCGVKDFIVGAIGKVAPLAVRRALSGRATSFNAPTYALTNVTQPDAALAQQADQLPIASRTTDTRFRTAAAYCYRLMDTLALDIVANGAHAPYIPPQSDAAPTFAAAAAD